ncbi:hypothetical protein BP6252_13927 [Coleophoma cylindrospora]|uniref:Heterokaryon incompatibility domain-containing protein n=1 Tax=Coleophoma cylindrospora TaxID=1849047 RepID=A0A3D8Q5A1_9HELO|nr:hypothetical protein BP6252_13927 [Coleophoma cylindrospora]
MSEIEFDDACSWPRRLLHVPTMTSWPWAPENRYGSYSSPKYNAVSYTWGRWQVTDPEEMVKVEYLPVKGVDWIIPRIDPEARFKVAEFQAMVDDTMNSHPSASDQEKIDFLWLDIACIDQTNAEKNAREVGRQAKIFQGATNTYIWLSHKKAFIQSWAPQFDVQFGMMCKDNFYVEVDLHSWMSTTIGLIKKLFDDPWFSSLWTLQEAFLCPNACLIFRDAGKNDFDYCSLKHICQSLLAVRDAVRHDDKIRAIDLQYSLSDLINQTGLLDAVNGNPMSLLMASRKRTAKHEEDHIYGIMQVFGFQLGKSAPDAIRGYEYSLEELTDQLGEAILLQNPILSQLHIHTSAVKHGRAWRFSDSSVVPEDSQPFFQIIQHGDFTYHAKLSTIKRPDGILWGRFSGPVALFKNFATRLTKDWPGSWVLGSARLMLDKVHSADVYVETNGSLAKVIWLKKHLPETIIILLALTHPTHQDEGQKVNLGSKQWAMGLLVSPGNDSNSKAHEPQFWRRVGFFIWSVESQRLAAEIALEPIKALAKEVQEAPAPVFKELPYLRGDDPIWQSMDGIFG